MIDVGAGLERRQDRVGAEIGVHADDRPADVGQRARLVHEWLCRAARYARDVVAFDAGDLQAVKPELARDRRSVRSAAARGLAAPMLVMIIVPASRQAAAAPACAARACAL